MNTFHFAGLLAGSAVVVFLFVRLRRWWHLLQAKQPSLSGHARWSRRISGLIPYYGFTRAEFFATDGAPAEIVAARRDAFDRLARQFRAHSPCSARNSVRHEEVESFVACQALEKISGCHADGLL